jgi:hypothetical protein
VVPKSIPMIFPMIEIRYLVVPVGQTPYQMQKAGKTRPSVIHLRQIVSFNRPTGLNCR